MKRKVGRRTGVDILAGKTIRKNAQGIENYDDYFTDDEVSDTSVVEPYNGRATSPKEKSHTASLRRSPKKSGHDLALKKLQNLSGNDLSSDESDSGEIIIKSTPKKPKTLKPKRKSLATLDKRNTLGFDTDDEDLFVPLKLDLTLLSRRQSSPVASTSRAGLKGPSQPSSDRLRLSSESDESESNLDLVQMPNKLISNSTSKSKAQTSKSSIPNGSPKKGRTEVQSPSSGEDESDEDPLPPHKPRSSPIKSRVPKPKASLANGTTKQGGKSTEQFDSDEDYVPDASESDEEPFPNDGESDDESIPPLKIRSSSPDDDPIRPPITRSSPSKIKATNQKSAITIGTPTKSRSDEELVRPKTRNAGSPAKNTENEHFSSKGMPQKGNNRTVVSPKIDATRDMLEQLTWSDSEPPPKSQREKTKSPDSGQRGPPQKRESMAKSQTVQDLDYNPSQSSESESHEDAAPTKKSPRVLKKILPKRIRRSKLEKSYREASSSSSSDSEEDVAPKTSKYKDAVPKLKAATRRSEISELNEMEKESPWHMGRVLPKRSENSPEKKYREASSSGSEEDIPPGSSKDKGAVPKLKAATRRSGITKEETSELKQMENGSPRHVGRILPKRKESSPEKTYREASSSGSEEDVPPETSKYKGAVPKLKAVPVHQEIKSGPSTKPETSKLKQTEQKSKALVRSKKSRKSFNGPSDLQSAVVQLVPLENIPGGGHSMAPRRPTRSKQTAGSANDSDSSRSTVVMPVKTRNVRATVAKESPKYGLRSSPLKADTMQKLLQNRVPGGQNSIRDSDEEIITYLPRKSREVPTGKNMSPYKKFLVFDEDEPAANPEEIPPPVADEGKKYSLRQVPKVETERRMSPRKKNVKSGGQMEDGELDLPGTKNRTKIKQKPTRPSKQTMEKSDEETDPVPEKRTVRDGPSTSGIAAKNSSRDGPKKPIKKRENEVNAKTKMSGIKTSRPTKRPMFLVVESEDESAPSPVKRTSPNASLVNNSVHRRRPRKVPGDEKDKSRRKALRNEDGNDEVPTESDLRRSKRNRFKPMERWKGERIKYKRTSMGFTAVDIIEGSKYVTKFKTENKHEQPKKSAAADYRNHPDNELEETGEVLVINPETNQECYVDCVRVQGSYVYTTPEGAPAKQNGPYVIAKPLQQKAFASGTIKIRPFMEKGTHYVHYDSMVFWVYKGTVEVTIHETVVVLKEKDTFFVPRGNSYNIKNITNKMAELLFFQHKQSREGST